MHDDSLILLTLPQWISSMALTTVLSKDDCHTTGIRQQAPGSTQVLSSVWLSVAVLSMMPCRFFASPRLIICAIRPRFGLSWISLASQNILMLRKMDDTQCPACEAMPKADVQGAYWQAPQLVMLLWKLLCINHAGWSMTVPCSIRASL